MDATVKEGLLVSGPLTDSAGSAWLFCSIIIIITVYTVRAVCVFVCKVCGRVCEP